MSNNNNNNIIRIEIHGQRDMASEFAIDRAMPASLINYLPSTNWNSFCVAVDNALTPARDLKDDVRHTIQYLRINTFIIIFIVAVFIVLSTMLPSVFEGTWWFLIITMSIGALGFLFNILLICRIKKAFNDFHAVISDVQKTVEAESAKQSDVSFHMKREQVLPTYNNMIVPTHNNMIVYSNDGDRTIRTQPIYFIEAQVSGTLVSVPMGGYVAAAPAVTANVVNPRGRTAERLKELKDARHLMTKQEYKNKKDAIIASL